MIDWDDKFIKRNTIHRDLRSTEPHICDCIILGLPSDQHFGGNAQMDHLVVVHRKAPLRMRLLGAWTLLFGRRLLDWAAPRLILRNNQHLTNRSTVVRNAPWGPKW